MNTLKAGSVIEREGQARRRAPLLSLERKTSNKKSTAKEFNNSFFFGIEKENTPERAPSRKTRSRKGEAHLEKDDLEGVPTSLGAQGPRARESEIKVKNAPPR